MSQAAGIYDAYHPARPREAGLQAFAWRQRLRQILRPLAVLLDSWAIAGAALIGLRLSEESDVVEPGSALIAVWLTYLAVGANLRAYSLSTLLDPVKSARLAAMGLAIAAGNVVLVLSLLQGGLGSAAPAFAAALGAAFVALAFLRVVGARFVVSRCRISPIEEVVICEGVPCPESFGGIQLDAAACGLAPRLDDPIALDRLGQHLRDADRVVVACRPERRADWSRALKGAGIRAEVFAEEIEPLGAIGLDRFAGRNTLIVATGPLGFVDRCMKRLLDIALVCLSAPVTLPLALLVALAIKLDSPGPVLFRQPRMGAGNRIFTVLKFRSMHNAQLDLAGNESTARDDRRVTRVGRLIRRTSIDELPQLINVLRGEMSLVGPRPHAFGSRAGERYFWDIEADYWQRHAVKPGITGLAQVRGLRGATLEQADLTRRLQADLEYLSGWTVWRDLRIIGATLGVIIHRNAY